MEFNQAVVVKYQVAIVALGKTFPKKDKLNLTYGGLVQVLLRRRQGHVYKD
jgi:hypothetical protein